MMFKFANIEYLYFLLIIPLVIALFIASVYLKKRAIKRFGQLQVISQLMPDVSNGRHIIKFIFVIIALALLIIAIAGPQFGSKLEEVKREGVELIIALDVSNSMLSQDIQPSRLERAKRAISKLVDKLQNDKIGLIAFAGDAYIQVPITTDYAATKLMLSSINPGIVSKQGTAIGAAIDLATKSFSPDNEKSKAIVIITDGENHEDDAVEAATLASEKGIVVHTIGMGSPDGGPIPASRGNDFRKDKEGNIIISKLDETMLSQIAAAGGGIYVRTSNSQSGLEKVLDEINSLEKQEIESKIYSEYEYRFQYIVALALIFLLADFLILERKNRLLRGIKLFK